MLDINELRQLHKDINVFLQGVDPLSGEKIDCLNLNDECVKKMLNQILDVMMAYGTITKTVTGRTILSSKEKVSASISSEAAATLVTSRKELSITNICKRININLIHGNTRTITAVMVNSWLIHKGYITTSIDTKDKVATVMGNQLGIRTEKRIGSSGEEHMVNLYNERAQQYIFDSLPEICEYINR